MYTLPRARNFDLVQQVSETETLIYDLTVDKAFCLNETASIVWQRCDGLTTIDNLARESDLTADLILLTLDELQNENLLADKIDTGVPSDRLSRRKLIMSVSAAAMALPVIASLSSPAAAQANSCIAPFNLSVGTATSAQPANQACTNATNTCCSASSFSAMDSVDGSGNHTCTVTCGNVPG